MKNYFLALILLMMTNACDNPSNKNVDSNQNLLATIVESLDGEFDNFQQAWQENTEEDLHRVAITEKHQHIHSIFKKMPLSNDDEIFFNVKHQEGRDSNQMLEEQIYHFSKNENGEVISKQFAIPEDKDLSNLQDPIETLVWKQIGDEIRGLSNNGHTNFILKDSLLIVHHKSGIFSNKISSFNMIKCRFFTGWIEYVLPEDPDSTYRMGDLVIHDQGGIIPLTFADGTRGPYSVELTQLVFAKTLSIMKLAIYEEPFEAIDYNSKSISYTWTNPESKRIGINLRKVLSGWTFIEPGYFSSNNFEENKK